MIIKKISWKNIMSYGNSEETISFSEKSCLWRLSGAVGAGKSTIMSLPKLLLYGKIKGIRDADIANRVNRSGWIRGEVAVGQDEFVIERGFAPSSLRIEKNGKQIDKSSLTEMQAVINTEILEGMTYQIFSNVLTPSLNNYRLSFVSMTPADKRAVIDKIFSLEIINDVNTLIKNDIKATGNFINNSNSQITALTQTIQKSEGELAKLSAANEEENARKIGKITEKIAETDAQLTENAKNLKIYNDAYYAANGQYTSVLYSKTHLSSELSQIAEKKELFKRDKCPTCGGDFHSAEYEDIKKQLDADYDEKKKACDDAVTAYDEYSKYIKQLSDGIKLIEKNIATLNANRSAYRKEISDIERASVKHNEGHAVQNIINDSNRSIAELRKGIGIQNGKMSNMGVLQGLYSDDGIKKKIMNNYIPALNEELRSTLAQFSFPYTLEFDNNFDPTLRCMGDEISVDNLSTGEHKELDIAVLCSFLRILKIKYPQLNLVCLDETISSLDPVSSKEIIKYLKRMSEQMDLNIMVVSHDSMEDSMFDTRLYITKELGFSKITYDE